ncbi:hypothetical protein HUS23_08670 [Ectothiorhodospiraceae bacterium 2226]|nr:hypothetical protein HUS23_08670 [Ectothiorhodospiraceae bacterium 2226]
MNWLAYLFAGLLMLLGVISFIPLPGGVPDTGVAGTEMVLGGVLVLWGGALFLARRAQYRGGLATVTGAFLFGIGVYVTLAPFTDPLKFQATAGVKLTASLLFLGPALALLALGHRNHARRRVAAREARLSMASERLVHEGAEPDEAKAVAGPGRVPGTLLDTLAEISFTKGPRGEDLYHPYGLLFRGRVVADPELKDRIVKQHKDFIRYVLPVAVIYGAWMGLRGPLLIDLFVLLLVASLLQWRVERLVQGLPVWGQLPGGRDVIRRMGRLYPSWLKRAMILNGLLLMVIAAAMPWLMRRPLVEIADLVAIGAGVGIACVLLGILLLRAGKSGEGA